MTTLQQPSQALEGVRVLDLTIITAGAAATAYLADMGAEIIKVEATTRIDLYRYGGRGERPWNKSPNFNTVNRNKYGVTLDLKQERGRELFLELVKLSDIVSENFRVGVMDGLGVGYEALRAVKPDSIMLSISSQGVFGPEAGYGSFGSTLDALSGLAWVTGYEDGPPTWSGPAVNYPDQFASTLAAGAALVALYHRMRTGEGCHIDFSQRESVSHVLGPMLLDHSLNAREPRRMGNGHPFFVPHGCYPCAGEDEWLTLSVRSEEEWLRLCRVIGRPELAQDPRFAAYPARYRNRAELDAIVSSWTSERQPRQAFETLAKAGLAAGPVQGGKAVLEDPQLVDRGFFQDVAHPEAGVLRMKTRPVRLSRTDGSIHMPAPTLGQHSREVLTRLLGLPEDELDELERQGVIGTEPVDLERPAPRVGARRAATSP